MLWNHHFKHTFWANLTKIITLNANAKEIITFKHTLWPNLTKNTITLNANVRSGQGARMDSSDLTMIQVDLIWMDDSPANSCPKSHMAFLLYLSYYRLCP